MEKEKDFLEFKVIMPVGIRNIADGEMEDVIWESVTNMFPECDPLEFEVLPTVEWA